MKSFMLLFGTCLAIICSAQDDTIIVNLENASLRSEVIAPVKVFQSKNLISGKTVEVLPRGVLEFKVAHNFGDIAGTNGGIKRFFGLDNASDIRLGFQYGLTDNLNIIAARAKGAGLVQQLYELGIKHQFMKQQEAPGKPVSVTAFVNTVVSSMKASAVSGQENSFRSFSDRLSESVQLMVARKFGNVSLQISPTYVYRHLVIPGEEKGLFAMGGGARLPITNNLVLLAEYYHPFHSQEDRRLYRSMNTELYDVFGFGFEILTHGHVFHLNFTNATETLENRFLPKTVTSWGNGQYRWAFTISRDFTLLR